MKKKRASNLHSVDSIRHKDKRANIPTEELRDFVAEDEKAPKTMLYPRDPSLDPQLVWKGKDEQDAKDLAVPVVPVYIQEKIHPQALIENLRDTAKPGEREPEMQLFTDLSHLTHSGDTVAAQPGIVAKATPHPKCLSSLWSRFPRPLTVPASPSVQRH